VSRIPLSSAPLIVQCRPRLPALTGVRIFAALHIYFFHLKQANDAGLLKFPLISQLPTPLANLIGRGYISTGFFFALSGFLLAYAYLKPTGRPASAPATFWKGRFWRLYPLYLLSLLLSTYFGLGRTGIAAARDRIGGLVVAAGRRFRRVGPGW
jgi:peptidoglycan/LPS O-acetylase OafA/YrhL